MDMVDRASSTLSSILGEQIKHVIKSTHKQISNMENGKRFSNDVIVYSIFLKGEGDVRFGILYVIPERDSRQIASKLLCVEKMDLLDDVAKSALSEVGNIISGSFFNAVSDITGLRIDLSTPFFATTSGQTIFEPHAEEFLCRDNDVITQIEFSSTCSSVTVHMLVIQDPDNARKLLNPKKCSHNHITMLKHV
jgi:chemotaxis protein CheC